jgi:hypothetical protein
MHCFVLRPDGRNLDEIKEDLKLGSAKSKFRFSRLNMSHRSCYDLVRSFNCVRPLVSSYYTDFYLATSGFKYPDPFLIKYSGLIELHVNVDSPLDFLSMEECALIHQIDRCVCVNQHKTEKGLEKVRELRQKLLTSLQTYK